MSCKGNQSGERKRERDEADSLSATITHFHYYENPGFVQMFTLFKQPCALEGTHPWPAQGWV